MDDPTWRWLRALVVVAGVLTFLGIVLTVYLWSQPELLPDWLK